MDLAVLQFFNHFSGQSDALDAALQLMRKPHFKAVPFLMLIWGLWFLPRTAPERTAIRERLTAALLLTLPVILLGRATANFFPIRYRPIQIEELGLNLAHGQSRGAFDGWSSMPSDHALMFFCLAVSLFLIHRGAGTFALVWAAIIVCLPRIILGLHWPSDILVGGLFGAGVALMFFHLLSRAVRWTGVIPFLEDRAAIAYPLLFLATYEIARMYEMTRWVGERFIG